MMKNTIKIIFIATILFLSMNQCEKYNKDDELSIKRTDYTGNQLRIDGYYYRTWEDMMYTMFFYQNGIILYGGAFSQSEIVEREIRYKNGTFYNHVNGIKYLWGTFKIEGNKISFERWQPTQPYLRSYVETGKILNDTTFIITELYRMQNGEKTNVKEVNEIYHFKQFSPKPDSTNSFIE